MRMVTYAIANPEKASDNYDFRGNSKIMSQSAKKLLIIGIKTMQMVVSPERRKR